MYSRERNSLTMYSDMVRRYNSMFSPTRASVYGNDFCGLAEQIRKEYIDTGRSILINDVLNLREPISYYFYLLLKHIDPGSKPVSEQELVSCINENWKCGRQELKEMQEMNAVMAGKLRKEVAGKCSSSGSKDREENTVNNREAIADLQKQKAILEQEIRNLQLQKNTLEQDLQRDKESAMMKLDEEIREERNRRYENLNAEIAREQAERKQRIADDMVAELDAARQARIDKINSEAAYQLRKEEEARYLAGVREEINRREIFENQLCQDMRQISAGFRGDTEAIVNQLLGQMQELADGMKAYTNQAVEALERSSANAINEVVDTERRLRKDDYEELLDNYAQLQESMFYNVPEEELGLKPTRIERYLKRFLRVLNRLGYEEYFPAIGESYDDEKMEAVEKDDEELPPDFAGYGVDGVISYGFSKNGEMCRKARVTVGKNFLGNSGGEQSNIQEY